MRRNACLPLHEASLRAFAASSLRGVVPSWFVVFVVALCGACAAPLAPEQQLVNDAASALGGADRLQAIKTLVIEGEGTQYNLGQDVVPGASGQTFAVTQYRRAIDFQNGRALTELTRVPKFMYFLGPAAQRQVQGIDGAVGYNVSAAGAATRVAEAAAHDRRAELLRHPVAAVRAALDRGSRVTNLRSEGGQSLVDVTTSDGRTFTLTVDATTKLPRRVSALANHVNLGDVRVSTTFADYQESGGVKLPRRLTTSTDDFTTLDVRVTKQAVDGDPGDLAAPGAVTSAAVPVAAPANVTVTEVSPGIWQLAGGSHRSVVVEFADRLILIEAPQNDARTLAVIAKARELRPGKPLTHVVNTHHHFDHSGGIRAAVSEGLTVMTHEGNAAFFAEIVKRPHTLVPDALAKNPQPLKLETVGDEKVISDGTRTMTLYAVPGDHTHTMLMAYFPREALLVEGDLYEPDEHIHAFAAQFLERVKERGLRVSRILSLHSSAVPFARLVEDAAKPVE